MISSRLPDIFLRFHSSKYTVTFLSRNVVSHPYPSILHYISDFSDEQREDKHTASPSSRARLPKMKMVVIGTYKSRLVKWLTLASSTRARELLSMEMVVTGTSCAW